MLLSTVYAFYEEGHIIMDCPFVPFHIPTSIVRHVELHNVAGALMDQPHEQKLGILVVHNKFRGMELGSQLGPQNRHICPFIKTKNRKPEGYSHPHTAPQWILMGNCKLEHRWSYVNRAPPIVLEVIIVETWKQHVKVGVIQSLNVGVTTTWMEMVIVPNINVVKRGVPIRSIAKLNSESSRVSEVRNLSWNLALPTPMIGVVYTPQMMFIKLIKLFMWRGL